MMGGSIIARVKPRSASISIVVTRANGEIENFGTVSYWHRNPLIRAAMNIKIWIKGKTR